MARARAAATAAPIPSLREALACAAGTVAEPEDVRSGDAALAPSAAADTLPDASLTRVERPESCSRLSRANVGGGLVAQITVLLQRLVNDALELRRRFGIQPHGSRHRAIQDRFENHASPRKGSVPVVIS
jgi:hypothetical protein